MAEIIRIVNEKDEVIGQIDREDITPNQCYRASALWLTNDVGLILLAKRSENKRWEPGCWGPAVAGTVTIHETYEQNIRKETKEEIGLVLEDLELGPKLYFATPRKRMTQWFFAKHNQDAAEFILQEEEVSEVRWWSVDELRQALEKYPDQFTPGLRELFGQHNSL